MPDIEQHAHVTVATIKAETWNQAWYSLLSWRGYLQSVPGCVDVRLGVRTRDDGDIDIWVTTLWEHPEQLDEWLQSEWVPREIFAGLDQPAVLVSDDILEELI